eukprot:COSAG01_NODE_3655_length_5822_cov_7.778438_3_plen_166_part_00
MSHRSCHEIFRVETRARTGRFSSHVTPRAWPLRNEGLRDFADEEELLAAVSASCCLHPSGVVYRGSCYLDGGFSDPMPEHESLPTVTVSVLRGWGCDVAPSEALRREMAPAGGAGDDRGSGRAWRGARWWAQRHRFLRCRLRVDHCDDQSSGLAEICLYVLRYRC